MTGLRVSTGFESARIEVLHTDQRRVRVAVPPDLAAPRFRQWFAFDVEGEPGASAEIVIDNAAECTWADAFGGDYRVYVSEGDAWRRGDSRVERGRLVLRHIFTRPRVRIAFYPPYPSSRLRDLRAAVREAGGAVDLLGVTPQGRSVERFVLGAGDKHVWVLAQQHPGEAMAGWFAEGLVAALCERHGAARALALEATLSIVPRMNPDGAAIGNHRTTPRGVDLNRSWASEDAPVEVSSVRDAMRMTGVHFALDIHGDERLPWVFAQPADRFTGRRAGIDRAIGRFEEALSGATPDFQTEHRYPYAPADVPSMIFGANWIQGTFDCPALTLEMPFSDHRGHPEERGFFPARARRLGHRAAIGILAAIT